MSEQGCNHGLTDLTVLVLTLNEEANIGRTLGRLGWATSILVVDSFSTDRTLDIVAGFPNARVVQREFTDFADQCNFGLQQITSEWTLSIDADYVLPEGAEAAILAAMNDEFDNRTARFEYCIYGKPVHGSILPPRTVLYRTAKARYRQDGHGHRVEVTGESAMLPFAIQHDDRKPLARWCQAQIRYAAEEADKLTGSEPASLSFNDRIRKRIVFAPFLVLFLVYLVRGGFLSGWRGLYYALQRFFAESLLSLFLIDLKLRKVLSAKSEGQ